MRYSRVQGVHGGAWGFRICREVEGAQGGTTGVTRGYRAAHGAQGGQRRRISYFKALISLKHFSGMSCTIAVPLATSPYLIPPLAGST